MTLNEMKSQVDKYLIDYFKDKEGYNKKLYEAMSYSINIGGKRIRPLLMILTYSMYKKDYENILPMAASIEMIHTYSLIHDDLPCMDDDDLRRGNLSNHKVFGETIALLAGDALLNEAFNCMIKCKVEDSLKLKAISVISKASSAEGMIGGQIVDILSENKSISADELYYMHNKKTGELIKASIIVGAILGGASREDIKILSKYGNSLGLVFQIKDDILDVEGDKNKLGKNINMDNNKTTFVTLYGLDKCKEIMEELTNECYECLNSLELEIKDLIQITNILFHREC